MKKTDNKIRVGISIGDPNGIGIEVIIKTFYDNRMFDNNIPIIYGSSHLFSFYREKLNLKDFAFNTVQSSDEAAAKKVNVVNVWNEKFEISAGESNSIGGQYALKSLKAAVEDMAGNKIDVLITAPINKNNIQSEDFKFPGHTEYLAHYANEENPLMIMVADTLRVGLVSGHVALKDVSSSISIDKILTKLTVFNKSLIQDFGITRPKIAVLGLNPHSGDNGLIGDEEKSIIEPAIEKAHKSGMLVFGPYAAD